MYNGSRPHLQEDLHNLCSFKQAFFSSVYSPSNTLSSAVAVYCFQFISNHFKTNKQFSMKRLLLIALLGILGYTTFAQAGSLTVTNSSSCTVYYVIRGDKVGTCGFNVTSSMITLPPGGSIVYPNSAAIPGFPPAPILWITVANIYPRPPNCGAPDIF